MPFHIFYDGIGWDTNHREYRLRLSNIPGNLLNTVYQLSSVASAFGSKIPAYKKMLPMMALMLPRANAQQCIPTCGGFDFAYNRTRFRHAENLFQLVSVSSGNPFCISEKSLYSQLFALMKTLHKVCNITGVHPDDTSLPDAGTIFTSVPFSEPCLVKTCGYAITLLGVNNSNPLVNCLESWQKNFSQAINSEFKHCVQKNLLTNFIIAGIAGGSFLGIACCIKLLSKLCRQNPAPVADAENPNPEDGDQSSDDSDDDSGDDSDNDSGDDLEKGFNHQDDSSSESECAQPPGSDEIPEGPPHSDDEAGPNDEEVPLPPARFAINN